MAPEDEPEGTGSGGADEPQGGDGTGAGDAASDGTSDPGEPHDATAWGDGGDNEVGEPQAQPGEALAVPAAALPSGPSTSDVVSAIHVSRWYGDVIAVNDLSVEIGPGITGLLGPNGAGKSTLLQMIVGLLRPSAGRLRVLGEDPWNRPRLLARIGYLPEGPPPWRELSGRGCVTRAALLSGLLPRDAEARAGLVLAEVGLAPDADRRVEAYSHGMQQRLKVALALVHDPALLVLDEPLVGTDPLSRRDLIRLLARRAAAGTHVLLSTHVLPDVEALTERVLILDHGRLRAHGDVAEIRDLLDRYPRTIRIETADPRGVGAALWGWPSVLSVEVGPGLLTVRTANPGEFYPELQRRLGRGDLPFTSVTSPDDNVEAVFRYLVG